MGVEAKTFRAFAAPIAPNADLFAPALPASPYSLSATDAAGHMRKLEELESEIIRLAIARYDGHMSEVARRLAIGRSTLYRKLKEFGLEASEDEAAESADEPPRQAAG
jgi:DNA-binding NtrC family response regulator